MLLIEKREELQTGGRSSHMPVFDSLNFPNFDFNNTTFHSQLKENQFLLLETIFDPEIPVEWVKYESKAPFEQIITIENDKYELRSSLDQLKEDLLRYFPEGNEELEIFWDKFDKIENSANSSILFKILSPTMLRNFFRGRVSFFYLKYGVFPASHFASSLTNNEKFQSLLLSLYLYDQENLSAQNLLSNYSHSIQLNAKCDHW